MSNELVITYDHKNRPVIHNYKGYNKVINLTPEEVFFWAIPGYTDSGQIAKYKAYCAVTKPSSFEEGKFQNKMMVQIIKRRRDPRSFKTFDDSYERSVWIVTDEPFAEGEEFIFYPALYHQNILDSGMVTDDNGESRKTLMVFAHVKKDEEMTPNELALVKSLARKAEQDQELIS